MTSRARPAFLRRLARLSAREWLDLAEAQLELLIAQFIVDTANALFKLQPAPPQITTLSIGASAVVPAQDWDDWYANADAALYRAKRLGGNRVEWQDHVVLAPA